MAFRTIYACNRLLSRSFLRPTPITAMIPGYRRNQVNGNRFLSVSAVNLDNKVATKKVQNTEYSRAIAEAERLVGYNSSFMNLRYIFNDEMASVGLQLRKILGSNHPLLRTAKSLLYNEKTPMQSWGLLMLLVSKAFGHSESLTDAEREQSDGILHTQRLVAEVIEIIRVSFLVHKSLTNLQPLIAKGQDLSDHGDDLFGNKIGLLTGDYLISVASSQLSSMRNHYVLEIITLAMRDMAEAEFVGDRDEQNQPLPSRPKPISAETEVEDKFDLEMVFPKLDIKGSLGHAEREWTVRNILMVGSLLARGCQSAMILAKLPKEHLEKAYLLGQHLALAWQTSVDMEPFTMSTIPEGSTFSLVSAPVLFHLQAHPEMYPELVKAKRDVNEVDFVKVHEQVRNGPGIEKTRQLQRKHIIATLKLIDTLPNVEARTALQNIALSMQDS